jgi:hypothetical protein
MDARVRPPTMPREEWRWSDAQTSGRVEAPKDSVSLYAKRAFPFRIYGPSRPARTAFRTAVPWWFADTEEDGGSTPPAPTIPAFSRDLLAWWSYG